MKTLKNRKWYQPHMMRRAGNPKHVFHGPVSAIAIRNGRAEYVATSEGGVAIWRDGAGVDKALARITADIPPERLFLNFGFREDAAREICERINGMAPSFPTMELKLTHMDADSLHFDFDFAPARPVEIVTITGTIEATE